MLIDSVSLLIKAGSGGRGSFSVHPKGGPDGGNGGNGGSIYFQGDANVRDLREFTHKTELKAEHGSDGNKNKKHGRHAEDITIKVPFGTKIIDEDTNEVFDIGDATTPILIAKGGNGAKGNLSFRASDIHTHPHPGIGDPGQARQVKIELRLIAEIGLIGLPNAGKSSLLSVLTNATPKIGNYPFTTLSPNIGMLDTHPIADIPGLIEGAAKGKGLGSAFLKHIEKTKLIVHCIELTNADIENSYKVVRQEFEEYNQTLLEKPEIILLTKTDMVDEETIEKYTRLFKNMGKEVITSSFYDDTSIKNVRDTLIAFVEKHKADGYRLDKEELLKRIKEQAFPEGEYIIYGAAPLAVYGVRDVRDIDMFVTTALYNELQEKGWKQIEKGPKDTPVVFDIFEAHNTWEFSPYAPTYEELKSRATEIDGILFASLHDIYLWKEASGRPKDLVDIEIIKKHL